MSQPSWDQILFINRPDLYLPVLLEARKTAEIEVKALLRIFKTLGVKQNSRILDLFCGIGRHSVYLAKMGYDVVGYDPCELFLDEATKWSQSISSGCNLKFYAGSPYRVSRILKKEGEDHFDVIILMGTCLGYKDERSDLAILKDIRILGSKNCHILVEIENRDWRIRNFDRFVNYYYEESEIHEAWKFDFESSISSSESMFYEKKNQHDLVLKLKLNTTLRLYCLHELKRMLIDCGWKFVNSYGSLPSLRPVDSSSENIICIGKKS